MILFFTLAINLPVDFHLGVGLSVFFFLLLRDIYRIWNYRISWHLLNNLPALVHYRIAEALTEMLRLMGSGHRVLRQVLSYSIYYISYLVNFDFVHFNGSFSPLWAVVWIELPRESSSLRRYWQTTRTNIQNTTIWTRNMDRQVNTKCQKSTTLQQTRVCKYANVMEYWAKNLEV